MMMMLVKMVVDIVGSVVIVIERVGRCIHV